MRLKILILAIAKIGFLRLASPAGLHRPEEEVALAQPPQTSSASRNLENSSIRADLSSPYHGRSGWARPWGRLLRHDPSRRAAQVCSVICRRHDGSHETSPSWRRMKRAQDSAATTRSPTGAPRDRIARISSEPTRQLGSSQDGHSSGNPRAQNLSSRHPATPPSAPSAGSVPRCGICLWHEPDTAGQVGAAASTAARSGTSCDTPTMASHPVGP